MTLELQLSYPKSCLLSLTQLSHALYCNILSALCCPLQWVHLSPLFELRDDVGGTELVGLGNSERRVYSAKNPPPVAGVRISGYEIKYYGGAGSHVCTFDLKRK